MTTAKGVTPLLRIFDERRAKEFYLDYLGFKLDWEHRFESGLPLYMQVSMDAVALHLTEHHGDCCPGSAIRIEVANVAELHTGLTGKNYKYMRPGLESTPWNTREVRVTDPFGNRIVFFETDGSRQEDNPR